MENRKEIMKARPKRGLWKPEEDLILKNYVETHGEGNWATVSKRSGLMRGGKSCRLRWKNYLRPNIKRGGMSKEEEDLIIRMHKLLGNRWTLIAGRLPGRTDNEVKNCWNTHLNKKSHLGKRKTSDSNKQQTDKEDNNIEKQDGNKPSQLHNSHQPIFSTSPERTTGGLDLALDLDEKKEMKDESGSVRDDGNAWMERAVQCFNFEYDQYDYEMVGTPLMMHPNYSNFVLDEDPFASYLDPFVLFEAFETDFSDVGMGIQSSFLP